MNPADYLKILTRRWWIFVLAAALVGASAFAFSRIQTPVYRATQRILVKPARPDNGLQTTLVNLLNSYKAWMDTNDLAAQVINSFNGSKLGSLDMTPDQLLGTVTTSVDRNSNLLVVDADMKDGEIAVQVARAYGEAFQQWRNKENAPQRLEDRINAELLGYPNYGLIRPQTRTNTLAGLLLGVLLGGVAVFIIEALSARIIRRGADIEQTLVLPVLGTIPENEVT